jgi:hypothetical protein
LKPGGLITICEVENQIYEADHPPYTTLAYRTAPLAARALRALRTATANQGIDIDAVHHIQEWLQPRSLFWAQTAEKYKWVLYLAVRDLKELTAFRIPPSRREVASRGFRDIQKQVVLMPVGAWHPDPAVQQVGDLIARGFALAWKQLEPFLIDDGVSPEDASLICAGAIAAYERKDFQVLCKYHMVYGTRI